MKHNLLALELESIADEELSDFPGSARIVRNAAKVLRNESVTLPWVKVESGQLPRGHEDVLAATITGHVVTAPPSRIRSLHADAIRNSEECFYTHWTEMPAVPSHPALGEKGRA